MKFFRLKTKGIGFLTTLLTLSFLSMGANKLGDVEIRDLTVTGTTTGVGGPSITNYFTNGTFEASATDGVSVGGGTVPTIGAETSAPLYGAQSSKITSGAGTGFVSYALSGIDNGVISAGVLTQVSSWVKTDNLVADGDWAIGVYNTTDAVYTTTLTNLVANSLDSYRPSFVPVAGKTYELRIEFTDTNAGRILVVDKLSMSPDSNAALGFTNYEPVHKAMATARTGDGIIPDLSFTDLIPGATYRIDWSFNTRLNDASNNDPFVSITVEDNGVGIPFSAANIRSAQNSLENDRQHSNTTIYTMTSSNLTFVGSSVTNRSQILSGSATVTRIPEEVNLLTQEVVTANAQVAFGLGTTSVQTKLDYSAASTLVSQVGTWVNDGSGEITIPASGTYDIDIHCAGDWGSNIRIVMEVGGVQKLEIAKTGTAASISDSLSGSGSYTFTKGDLVTFVASGPTSVAIDPIGTYVIFKRRQQYGAFSPVGFALATPTQYGLVKSSSGTWTPTTSGSSGTVGTITYPEDGFYQQIGDIVSCGLFINTTGWAEAGRVFVTLPIAPDSSFSGYKRASGSGEGDVAAPVGAFIVGSRDTTSSVDIHNQYPGTTTGDVNIHFMYRLR